MRKQPTHEEFELKIRNRIAEIFLTVPDDEMYAKVLDVVLEAMESKFGVFGYIDENGDLVCPSMTREIFAQCQVPEKDIVFPRKTWGGIWGRSLIEKKAIYSNKSFRVPQGHIPITRSMSLPIIYRNELIGHFHIANKATDYTNKDKVLLETIADNIAPVLHARLQRDRQEKELQRTNNSLRVSEKKYRSLFENMLSGFAYCKIIVDKKNKPIDWVYLEVNDAFEKLTGLKSKDVVGKKATKAIPGIKDYKPDLFSIYGNVALTGKSTNFDIYFDPLEIWVTVSAYCPQKGYFTAVFENITERKRAEEELDKHRLHLERMVKERTVKLSNTNKKLKKEITERKKVEEALRESEGKYKTLVENIKFGITLINKNYTIIMTNSGVGQLFNKDIREFVGKKCYREFKKRDSVCPHCPGTKAMATGLTQETYTEGVRDDGTKFSVWIRAFPQFNSEGKISGFIELVEDITECKRMEETLSEREEQYRGLVETSQDLIFKCNSEACFTYLNPAWEEMLGYKAEEMLGHRFAEFKTPEQTKKDLKTFKNTLAGQDLFGYETIYISKSGELKNLIFNARVLKDADGNIVGTQGTAYDITGRKRAEEEVRKLSRAVEQSPLSIVITDINGNIEYVNPYFTRMTGYSFEEILGQNPSILKSGEQPPEFYKQLWDTIASGNVWQGQFHNKKKNGELYWESAAISPITDSENVITHFVGIKEDITEHKKTEEELAKHREHLEESVKERTAELEQTHKQLLHAEKLGAIGKLSGSIAHEFNNPLFGIMNVLGRLKRNKTFDKTDKEHLDIAIDECKRIKNLIINLQDFNRPTSGVVAPMDIHKTLDDMLFLSKKQFKTRKIKIQKYYASDMPKIHAVEDQIKQVVLNILNNAGEAITKAGGTIKISTETLKGKISIQIQDSGGGIKPENMDKIFEPFFTTKSAVKGTGLGLSVSYGIIKKHGGDIEVKSEPGKGTSFTIILPTSNNPG